MKENIEKSFKQEIIDFIKDLVVVFFIVLVIRTYLILPFQISWQSMYDSYYDREFIIVDRFSYLVLWEPKRGDVIVFKPHVSDDKEYFIKRIIGLPWDTIKISGWKVYLKEKSSEEFIELKEGYLSKANKNATYIRGDDSEYIFEVPENSYFVMWDNRNASTDSRTCFSSCLLWGKTNYINSWDIVWRVLIDLWYFNFRNFSFTHPTLWISTFPRFFTSPSTYEY